MGQRPRKWPTYALAELEKTLVTLKQLEKKASTVEDAIVLGNDLVALRELSDVRVLALECVANLVSSRIGKYEQEGEARQWNKPTADQTAQAVAQVVASRRP